MLPSRTVPRHTREAYRCDRLSSYLAGIYTGAIFPFVGVIARERLQADALVLSMLTAAPFLGNLTALFWARAMEGRPKLPYVKWSQLAARLVCLLTIFATTPLRFAAVIGLVQVFGTIGGPAYAAVLKEVYPDSERGRIMSYTRAALFSASVVATFAIGPLLRVVDFRYVFPVAALFGIAAALVFGRMPVAGGTALETGRRGDQGDGATDGTGRPGRRGDGASGGDRPSRPFAPSPRRLGRPVAPSPRPSRRSPRPPVAPVAPSPRRVGLFANLRETARFLIGTLGILRHDRRYRWFALSVFAYGFGNLMVAPVIPLVQVDRLHISTEHIALLSNLSQMTTAVSYFFWGRYVDRHSPLQAVVINILLSAWVPVCYYAARNIWMIAPAFVIGGITTAGIDLSYFNGILSFADEENVSRYQAVHSFMLGIRGLIAPFLGGGLTRVMSAHGWDVRSIFLIALAFILAGGWMQLAGLRRDRADASRREGSIS